MDLNTKSEMDQNIELFDQVRNIRVGLMLYLAQSLRAGGAIYL